MTLTIKRVLSVLICIMLLFGAVLPGGVGNGLFSLPQAKAAEEPTSGPCGAEGGNVTWTMNTETGELVFSGSGEMFRYANDNEIPWRSYRPLVRTAVFSSGITNVGVFALNKCSNLVYVTLSSDVKRIENHAFRNCDFLRDVYYGGSPEQWADIYVGNGNTSLSIPKKHYYCSGVQEVPYTSPDNIYPFNITYHQTEASSLLAAINELRTGGNAWYWNRDNMTKTVLTDLAPLAYDCELEQIAMQRAAEIVVMYTDQHLRPNGGKLSDLFTDFSFDEEYSYGENIAYHLTTAADVQNKLEEADEYYAGQGHRRNMLHRQHTAVGLACAEYNGIRFWVQIFRSRKSNAPCTAPQDDVEPVTVSIELLDQYILSNTVYTASQIDLEVGVSTALPPVNHCFTAPDEEIPITHEKEVEWASGDPTIVRVTDTGITAFSRGSTTLTGTFDGGQTVAVSVNVTGNGPAYAVSYDANGAASGAVPKNQIKEQGCELTLAANTGRLEKPGYALDGWATAADGEKVYDLGGSYTDDAAATLYAHWTPNTYSVHFNGSGATNGAMSDQAFTYDAEQALTANAFERAFTVTYHYNGATGGCDVPSETATSVFNGWATEASGAKIYDDAQPVKNLAESGTCELYACWTSGTVTLPDPSNNNLFFVGWYADAGMTAPVGAGGSVCTPDRNMNLYAKWADEPVTLTDVAVKTPPAKTVYNNGEPFDQSGLTLTATYSDGSTQTVTSGFTCSGFDAAAAGVQTVTVSFEGKTTTFTVTVLPPDTLQSIAVAAAPAKTTYTIGEAFDPTGLKVTGAYSVSGTKEITDYSLSAPDMTTAGTKTVTVSFEGKTTTFTVTVLPPDTLQSIAVAAAPTKTAYYVGEAFSKTGLKVTGTYSVSGTKEITNYTLSVPDMTTAGTKTVTVSFEDKTATFTVTVRGRVRSVFVGDMTVNYKASAALKPAVTADADAACKITYSSSSPNVVKVNDKGDVTGLKRGTATVTCTVTDQYGNTVSDTCKVTVKYTPLQWIIIILLFGWIWY